MPLKPLEQEWVDRFLALIGQKGEPTLEDPAPKVERFGPGTDSKLTSPLSSIKSYGKQGPALRDPAFPVQGAGSREGLLSRNEHVQAFGIDKRMTRDPQTGRSFLEAPQTSAGQPVLNEDGTPKIGNVGKLYRDMTTVRTTNTTGDAKDVLDMRVIDAHDAAEANARAQKGSFDPYEDLSPALKQQMTPQAAIERELAAARDPVTGQVQDPTVTRASATTSVHGQEGTKFAAGKEGHGAKIAEILKGTDTDAFVDNTPFELAPDYLHPVLPGLDEHGRLPPSSDPQASTDRAAAPDPAEPTTRVRVADPVETVPAETGPVETAPVEAPAQVRIASDPVPASAAPAEAEAAAAAEGAGGLARGGLLGAGIAAGMQVAQDWDKVKSGQMSITDAAVDVGGTAAKVGALTMGGEAVANAAVAGTGAEAGAIAAGGEAGAAGAAASTVASVAAKGGVVGAVVAGGLALWDDVGKVKSGQMTAGTATADVAAKTAVGVGAGMAGAAAGAEIGALAGSVVPGLGNAVGFVAGAVVGGVVGYVGSEIVGSETGQAVIHAAGEAVDAAVDGVEKAGSFVAEEAGKAVDAVENAASGAVDAVEDAASSAWDKVTSLF